MTLYYKPLFCMQNENNSEEDAEEQGDDVDQIDGAPALDEEGAEETLVFRVGAECQDPVVCQEGQGGGEALKEIIHFGQHFQGGLKQVFITFIPSN